jgi:hypothetical protein
MVDKHSIDKSNKPQEIAMASQRSVVFAEPVRTAIGTFGGSLKDVPAPNLGAMAIGAAVARAKLRPDQSTGCHPLSPDVFLASTITFVPTGMRS